MPFVIVSGAIANKLNQGGEAWVRLSYGLGLRRLGYDVHFIEQIHASGCVDEQGRKTPFESSANKAYFLEVMTQFGLEEAATLIPIDAEGNAPVDDELLKLAGAADALINISGHLTLKPLLDRIGNKVFVDIDPGYTQYWHAEGLSGAQLGGHDRYFTIGENIGGPDCCIPTSGIQWRSTRPPVVLDEWPVVPTAEPLRFTTIANWRGAFGPVQFDGKSFGLKVHEFRKLIALPQQAPGRFEIALNIHPADHQDLAALKSHQWQITDPVTAASTPERFRHYVQQSGAEFSVAQGIYVDTNCGWFSDRTVRYLASGKPVLVQDTGFTKNIPSGKGLVAFRTLDEAIRGAESIEGDYETHSRAAREIAEQYFDSDKVLGQLMKQIGFAL